MHICISVLTSHVLLLSLFWLFVIVGGEASASVEHIISPIILNMWALHVSDPFISIEALEVLEVFEC